MIQTKQELIEAIHANEEKILSFGVKRLGLFGSFVREEQNEKSDIDLFVEFKKKYLKLKNLVGLGYYVQDISGRKVEIITPGSLSKYFGHRILNETEYIIHA